MAPLGHALGEDRAAEAPEGQAEGDKDKRGAQESESESSDDEDGPENLRGKLIKAPTFYNLSRVHFKKYGIHKSYSSLNRSILQYVSRNMEFKSLIQV